MNLIAPLAAGITGAHNGHAEIYLRGTGTRAPVYTTFEGDGLDISGADIALDEHGGATVYVNVVVDVDILDEDGLPVRSFTVGSNAGSIEVISPSFTGTDYVGGATGANKPTTLQAVLDAVITSFGSTNWNTTGAVPISSAAGTLSGIFYNVKSYGAVGNGATNDAAAITSAIAAAAAAGGGTVYFPPGVYLTNSSIVQNSLTPFKGAGSNVSFLRFNAAATGLSWVTLLEDLSIDSSLNLSGAVITSGVNTSTLRMSRCVIGRNSFSATTCIEGGPAVSMAIDSCHFNVRGATQSAVLLSASNYGLQMQNSSVLITAAVAYSGVIINVPANGTDVQCVNCIFDWSANFGAVSTAFLVDYDSPGSLSLAGCELRAANAPTVVLIDFDSSTSTGSDFSEVGTTFAGWSGTPTNVTLYDLSGMTLTTHKFALGARETRRFHSIADGSHTIDAVNYGSIVVERSANGAQTLTFPDCPVGCELGLLIHNNHAAGSGTITLDTTRVKMLAASNQLSLAANTLRYLKFRSEFYNSTLRWVEVGLATADEPE